MRNFKQTYRTILAFLFLGVFLNVFITDIACFVGKLDFSSAENHSHSHSDEHGDHHSHKVKKKTVKQWHAVTFSDNSCCKEETSNFYSSVSKIVVAKSMPITFPLDLILYSIDSGISIDIPRMHREQTYEPSNKAPPDKKANLFLLNETFII